MTKPKTACLDGDILVYKAAFLAEIEGVDVLGDKIEHDVKKWRPKGTKDFVVALSCGKSDNFRKKIWPLYKSNRDNMHRPEYLSDAYEYMENNFEVVRGSNVEADDILGLYASSHTGIAVTIDKDLRGVDGWHYNPDKEKKPVCITEEEAEDFFFKQWMTGDSTDGIPGLWRVGPKKAEKFLDEWEREEWIDNILEMYETDKYIPRELAGVAPESIGLVMARCVKILDTRTYDYDEDKITMWCPKVGS
tara:strand:- start:6476 stop:7219 length:744 start_codon:yes stop_codon:yes gene_type:complete